MLNMGVFLRAAGVVSGDLPGRGPIAARAVAFTHALLTCMWPNTHFPMLDAMRARFSTPMDVVSADVKRRYYADHPERSPSWPELHFTDEAILARYGLVESSATQIITFFRQAPIHSITSGDDVATVLTADYDLTCNHAIHGTVPVVQALLAHPPFPVD